MISKDHANIAADALLAEANSRRIKGYRVPLLYRGLGLEGLEPRVRFAAIKRAERNVGRSPWFIAGWTTYVLLLLFLWTSRNEASYPKALQLLIFCGPLPVFLINFMAIRQEVSKLAKPL